jgi:hypothetical protein
VELPGAGGIRKAALPRKRRDDVILADREVAIARFRHEPSNAVSVHSSGMIGSTRRAAAVGLTSAGEYCRRHARRQVRSACRGWSDSGPRTIGAVYLGGRVC